MSPGILFLTGAPESSFLNWDSSLLTNVFIDPISRFLGESKTTNTSTPLPTAASKAASWRDLPLERTHLPTGLSQNLAWQDEYRGNAAFLKHTDLSFQSGDHTHEDWSGTPDSTEGESLSHFYEHSFAVHEDIASSQIPSRSSQELSQPGDETTVSFNTTSFSNFSESIDHSHISNAEPPRGPPTSGHLSDLEDIPNANYLTSIQPQTMTANVIVGIISISAPRTISTRRGATVSLIEVLVGDETKSGFGINFWISPDISTTTTTTSNPNPTAGQVLSTLRPQDIILVRNVALSSFRGKVFGQSLRKELTKVDLLFRNRVDRRDVGGCYTARELAAGGHPQLVKAKRVREWVLSFVGAGTVRRVRRGGAIAYEQDDDMPPTTQ